jgi:predicted amidohydrolase
LIARIAVANLRFPPTPEESVSSACEAIRQAAVEKADLICFPESSGIEVQAHFALIDRAREIGLRVGRSFLLWQQVRVVTA